MKIGLHIPSFTWPSGPQNLASEFARIAGRAEDAGIDRVSVMDHVWQIHQIGPPEHEMLEAYTALGYLAAMTRRVTLMTLVTGVTYRSPGLLAKIISTLDVLSSGRAMLGIGAAWNAEEAAGVGLDFAPVAERFERLEEALQIILQMWSDDDGPYSGKHYKLGRTLNSPQPLQRPRPKILIGGSGERKTLRLVARYADACNVFYNPEVAHKLEVLRAHCEAEGRNYDEIEKTVNYPFALGENGENVNKIVEDLHALSELGFSVAHGRLADIADPRTLELVGEKVVPVVAAF